MSGSYREYTLGSLCFLLRVMLKQIITFYDISWIYRCLVSQFLWLIVSRLSYEIPSFFTCLMSVCTVVPNRSLFELIIVTNLRSLLIDIETVNTNLNNPSREPLSWVHVTLYVSTILPSTWYYVNIVFGVGWVPPRNRSYRKGVTGLTPFGLTHNGLTCNGNNRQVERTHTSTQDDWWRY